MGERRRRRTTIGVVAAILAGLSIGARAEMRPPEEDEIEVSDHVLADLEEKLLRADAVRVIVELHADGAVEAALEGEVVLGPEGRARVELNGTFAGEEMDLLLVSTGDSLAARAGERTTNVPTPPALREAIVLGLVRMGALHNAARLTQALPPDHAEGGVGEWVRVENVSVFESETRRGERAVAAAFDVWVGDRRSATATLYLSRVTGLPLERTQTVTFPNGVMNVVERFIDFELNPDVEPETFANAQ